MEALNTNKIDQFISSVQVRLILKFVVLPILVLLLLFGAHLFAEGGIDRLGWGVPLGWPLNSWYFWLPFLVLLVLYILTVRKIVTTKGTCREIDDFYAPHSDAARSSFSKYQQNKAGDQPMETSSIIDLNRRLRNEDLYDPARMVPLWNWKWFWRMLIILLLLWLLLLLLGPIFNNPFGGLLPGGGQTEQQESLEEKADRAAQNSHSESAKSTANDVKKSAQKMNRSGMSQEEKQDLLQEEEEKVKQEQQQLEDEGQLYENLSRAANSLSEEKSTKEAGESLFRRNPMEAFEDLKNLPQQASNPQKTAEALKEAANAMEETKGMEKLGEELKQLAKAVEQGQPLEMEEAQELKDELQNLQNRLEDAQTMKKLRQDIREEMRRQQRMDQAQQRQQQAEQQMIQTLEEMSEQASQNGQGEMGKQMEQLSRQLQRGIVSPQQMREQLQQIDQQMQEAQMSEMQQELMQATQELENSLLDYQHASQQRQKIEGPLNAEKFELNPGQDSTGNHQPPVNAERILSKPQVEDSRVPRPMNTSEDLELFKNVYDKRNQ